MPLYHFKCPACDRETDVSLSIGARDTTEIVCKNPAHTMFDVLMMRVPTMAAFELKGAGFHKNDYPSKVK